MTPRADERGVVAGTDVLLFGSIVLVALILLFAQLWRVYEAEAAAAGAGAREAARTFVESNGDDPGRAVGAGTNALAQLGASDGSVTVSAPGGFSRCQLVVAEAIVVVPAVRLPFVGGVLGHTAQARHVERIDPFRSGLDGDAGACDAS